MIELGFVVGVIVGASGMAIAVIALSTVLMIGWIAFRVWRAR